MSEGTGKVKKVKKPKSALREYVEAITIALTLALGLRFFVIEAFKIPSGSMIETLAIGDFIFVNKLSYRTEIPYSLLGVKIPGGGTTLVEWSGPDRGDVAVFRFPKDPSVDYIKRIVAIEGDTVELRRGEVFLNGEKLERKFIRTTKYNDQNCRPVNAGLWREDNGERTYEVLLEERQRGMRVDNHGPETIKPGHAFAMGDNRDNSSDSRIWGQVPVENIKGRALFVWLSRDSCGGFLGLRWSRFFEGVR
jgi:signal peptidase I